MDHPQRDVNVPTTYLRAAAGGAGGSWCVLMEGLARLVAEIIPSSTLRWWKAAGSPPCPGGGGGAPDGDSNPPMTAVAIEGRGPYDQAYPALRVGVANLTANYIHCVVEQALPLPSVAAWLEQRYPLRLPLDPRHGGPHGLPADAGALRRLRGRGRTVGRRLVPAKSYDEQLALALDMR